MGFRENKYKKGGHIGSIKGWFKSSTHFAPRIGFLGIQYLWYYKWIFFICKINLQKFRKSSICGVSIQLKNSITYFFKYGLSFTSDRIATKLLKLFIAKVGTGIGWNNDKMSWRILCCIQLICFNLQYSEINLVQILFTFCCSTYLPWNHWTATKYHESFFYST